MCVYVGIFEMPLHQSRLYTLHCTAWYHFRRYKTCPLSIVTESTCHTKYVHRRYIVYVFLLMSLLLFRLIRAGFFSSWYTSWFGSQTGTPNFLTSLWKLLPQPRNSTLNVLGQFHAYGQSLSPQRESIMLLIDAPFTSHQTDHPSIKPSYFEIRRSKSKLPISWVR